MLNSNMSITDNTSITDNLIITDNSIIDLNVLNATIQRSIMSAKLFPITWIIILALMILAVLIVVLFLHL